jgi:bacillithiol system protein YtxJ
MGLIKSLRGLMNNQPEGETYWRIPENKNDVDSILNNDDKPQIIFKHSSRCGTSILSKSSLDSGMESISQKADVFMIDVVAMREISNYVAEVTGVKHESPQLLLIKNGEVFWHASHGEVRIDKLSDVLEESEKG